MPETNEPMDPSVREERVGTPIAYTQRICYAARQLAEEVHALFPETPVEFSNPNGRNVALDVSFDLTVLDPADAAMFITLLSLLDDPTYNLDQRIREVMVEDQTVLVGFRNDHRTQDSREPFGLSNALAVLAETEGEVAL